MHAGQSFPRRLVMNLLEPVIWLSHLRGIKTIAHMLVSLPSLSWTLCPCRQHCFDDMLLHLVLLWKPTQPGLLFSRVSDAYNHAVISVGSFLHWGLYLCVRLACCLLPTMPFEVIWRWKACLMQVPKPARVPFTFLRLLHTLRMYSFVLPTKDLPEYSLPLFCVFRCFMEWISVMFHQLKWDIPWPVPLPLSMWYVSLETMYFS